MSDKPQQASSKRKPDCVTEVRVGNTILTVKGYFKQGATETAADSELINSLRRVLASVDPRRHGGRLDDRRRKLQLLFSL